ncbi:hypothetical protein HMPREF8571_1010 [Streptococcus mitis ATCC 6249]|uniref:Uncharacterized protein n=1 Tax=Streptococcus mitis ATCC 6249 TaxID=864567 RepID=E0PR80_STRMT|nr:hypothetical protein HMPREF8571_1010 [Streptococcus mitis ATCC 6249]
MNQLSIFYSSPLLSLEWTLYKKDFLENYLKKSLQLGCKDFLINQN